LKRTTFKEEFKLWDFVEPAALGSNMGWTFGQLVEAKTRCLSRNIPKMESELERLKVVIGELRQQAAKDDAEATQLLEESRNCVDSVTSDFLAGARYWGELRSKLKKKEAEVAQLKVKLEALELDEAAEAEEEEGEERSITITISIYNSVVGAIIGRGGEKLTRIREVSQATIDMTRECNEKDERTITISGSAKQVRYARLMIQDAMEGRRSFGSGHVQDFKSGSNRDNFKAA